MIRPRFTYLTNSQIARALAFKWQNLTREQRGPFEEMADEDRHRYDKECQDIKKGIVSKKQQKITLKPDQHSSAALELTNDLLDFIKTLPSSRGSE